MHFRNGPLFYVFRAASCNLASTVSSSYALNKETPMCMDITTLSAERIFFEFLYNSGPVIGPVVAQCTTRGIKWKRWIFPFFPYFSVNCMVWIYYSPSKSRTSSKCYKSWELIYMALRHNYWGTFFKPLSFFDRLRYWQKHTNLSTWSLKFACIDFVTTKTNGKALLLFVRWNFGNLQAVV